MLLLVPAGVLVLVLLAGITFDFVHLHLAQRELVALAESVANDAATYALDQDALRTDGQIVFRQSRAERIAERARVEAPTDLHITALDVRVDPGTGSVVVTASATVDPVFLRAVPGEAVPRRVRATARAVLAGDTSRQLSCCSSIFPP